MNISSSSLKAGSEPVRGAFSAARGARNRATRAARQDESDAKKTAAHHKRRLAQEERDRERAANRRLRVQVPEADRPRSSGRTPRKLFTRRAAIAFAPLYAPVDRQADGKRSVHFAFVARGFASTSGRGWRAGEAARAAQYIVREDALEAGELGWWSNISSDRNEAVAFWRTVEDVERHDRKNANVYVTEVIALDATMTARQRRRVVKRICADLERRGLGYLAAIHLPDQSGDQRNFHAHIIYSLRPAERHAAYDWSFAVSKVSDLNTKDGIRGRRELVVRSLNKTLVAMNSQRRYTALSNAARGLSDEVQPKVGQAATWIFRRMVDAERRAAALDKLGEAAAAVRAALDLADKVAALGRTVAQRMHAAGHHVSMAAQKARSPALATTEGRLVEARDQIAASSAQAEAGLKSMKARLRSRLVATVLPLTRLENELALELRPMADAVRDRQGRRARLLLLQADVAHACRALPSVVPVTDRLRAWLRDRMVDVGTVISDADPRVAELRQEVLRRLRTAGSALDGAIQARRLPVKATVAQRLAAALDRTDHSVATGQIRLKSIRSRVASRLARAALPLMRLDHEADHSLKRSAAVVADRQRQRADLERIAAQLAHTVVTLPSPHRVAAVVRTRLNQATENLRGGIAQPMSRMAALRETVARKLKMTEVDLQKAAAGQQEEAGRLPTSIMHRQANETDRHLRAASAAITSTCALQDQRLAHLRRVLDECEQALAAKLRAQHDAARRRAEARATSATITGEEEQVPATKQAVAAATPAAAAPNAFVKASKKPLDADPKPGVRKPSDLLAQAAALAEASRSRPDLDRGPQSRPVHGPTPATPDPPGWPPDGRRGSRGR